MTAVELIRMAERSEEDGHERTWFPLFAHDRRTLDQMVKSANAAKSRAIEDEQNFVPSLYPNAKP